MFLNRQRQQDPRQQCEPFNWGLSLMINFNTCTIGSVVSVKTDQADWDCLV